MIPEFKFALDPRLNQWCDEYNKTHDNKLSPQDFLPYKAHNNDDANLCYDVRCAEPDGIILFPDRYYKVSLGFRYFPEPFWAMKLKTRSGSFWKKNLHVMPGEIDSHFEGMNMVLFQFILGDRLFKEGLADCQIEFGERIAQIEPCRIQPMKVTEISNEEIDALYAKRQGKRGTGGFNSTGNK